MISVLFAAAASKIKLSADASEHTNTRTSCTADGDIAALPPLVRSFIEDRYLAGTANAEAQYKNAAGDEDALTGALGALIPTAGPVRFSIHPGIEFVVEINVRKIPRARRRRAGETAGCRRHLPTRGDVSRTTCFPKRTSFSIQEELKGEKPLADQARVMKARVRDGIVIDYAPGAYSACASVSTTMIRASSLRKI